MTSIMAYGALFAAAFLAATILPAQSELGLAALIHSQSFSVIILIIVASIGNILGAIVNWMIGKGIGRFHTKKVIPASQSQLDRATKWYQRFGKWSLLLSWVPIIGDPLTLIAGILRVPFMTFLVLVAIAKITRYIIVAVLVLNLS